MYLLKIKDRTWDSQSEFQLLEYQTSLLNSMFCLYFREKDFDWGGGEMVEWGGGGGFAPLPPQLYN
jgi:hypothetical protein